MKVIKNKKRTAMSLVMVITMTLMMLVASSASAFATQAYGFNFRVEARQADGRVESPVHYRSCDIRPAAKSLNISGKQGGLNKSQYPRIEQDLKVLDNIGFNTSCINSAKMDGSKVQFKVVLGDYKDIVQVVENNKDSTTLKIVEDNICNMLTVTKDGNVFLDGNLVTSSKTPDSYTNPIEAEPFGGYKVKWSLKPFAKSYPRYVTSGTENVFLGKCIDSVALVTFAYCLGKLVPYAAELLAATSIGIEILSYLKKWDPRTKYVGCKYKTYASGPDDFKYVSKLYPNRSCSGSKYKTTVTYARFRWV